MMRPRAALLLLLLLALPVWSQAPLRIAVMAYRPKAQVTAQWLPMAKHLETVLGRPITITAFDYNEMNDAIARSEVDVVLTNPGHYVLLKQRNAMSAPLVTQVSREGEHRLSAFGGVIFARAEDSRITSLRDLANKRIASVGIESLGGYQMQAFELLEAGVRLPGKDRLISLGMPHDRTVEAVLSGRADAGFVRSGVLEALESEGRIDLRKVKILNRQDLSSFPYAVSTRLHPEWPVAILPQIDAHLADQLAIALLSIRPDSPEARAAGIFGFTTPSDYSGVEQLLRRLRLPPFDTAPEFTAADLWERFAPWITALGVLVAALLGMSVRLVMQNRRIQQSEARSSTILNNLDAHIYLKNLQGHYIFVNQKVLETWERPLEEVIGFGDEAFFDAASVARIRQVDREVLLEGKTLHTEEAITPIGRSGRTTFYWSTKLPLRRPDGSIYALCGISTDITDRKQSEETRAYLAAIVESSDDAIVSKSLQGIITSWNHAAVRMFGYSVEEALGQSILLLLPPDRTQEESEILERITSGLSIERFETVRVRKDGVRLEVSVTISPIRNAEGRIIGASKIIRDITDRKRAEESLRESQWKLQLLLDSTAEAIYGIDMQGKCTFCNPACLRMTGYSSADQLLGKNMHDLIHYSYLDGRHFPVEACRIFQAFKAGEGTHADDEVFWRADGTSFPAEYWSFPQVSAGQTFGAVVTFLDITERKRVEDEKAKLQVQLMQAQKMDSLGSLAGGVAHDMNNVLGAILGLATATIPTQPENSPTYRAFHTIIQAATRGGKMVKSLLSFARQSPTEEREIDVNEVLREEARMLERTTLAKVRLVMDLVSDLRPIRGDAAALTHAFMNLCVNAVDAMQENCVLTLRTRNTGSDSIEVTIEDTGGGMPKEVLEKALDPFFTTKEVGKGTGLGLPMVYRTVEAHQGRMEILSEVGQGTRVLMRFPACEPALKEPVSAVPPRSKLAPIALTVLVVDDDELIQSTTQALLELQGHTAITVPSGEEALSRLEAGLAPDVIILDMNMPGLGGAGTLPRLRALNPTVPVMLATGRVDQFASNLSAAHPHVTLLPKPYTMEELKRNLETVTGISKR